MIENTGMGRRTFKIRDKKENIYDEDKNIIGSYSN